MGGRWMEELERREGRGTLLGPADKAREVTYLLITRQVVWENTVVGGIVERGRGSIRKDGWLQLIAAPDGFDAGQEHILQTLEGRRFEVLIPKTRDPGGLLPFIVSREV